MKTILKPHTVGIFLSLLFLCSCATEHPARLPADVPMNKGAGRGDELLVTLHLENGEKLLFVVDTGTTRVLLDKSLEPQLGKCFWTQKIHGPYGMKTQKLFRAPKLYLGDTQLQTSGWIWTADLSIFSNEMARDAHTNRPIMGILGMSCLKHYCVQLDFAANELRFLNEAQSDRRDWGKAFPLKHFKGCFAVRENLVGVKGQGSLIDTGSDFDGFLTPKLFQDWTNHMNSLPEGQAHSPNCLLGGDSYPEVNLAGNGGINGIGLSFLARHLVTIDFPNRTMYLKRTSTGPLIDEDTKSALEFLTSLREQGQLPGWSKDDKGNVNSSAYPISNIFDAWKNGDPDAYHYTVVQNSSANSWKLQRAWQTDKADNVIQEFPVQ